MQHTLGRIEYGGPDLAPRRLRNLLQQYVDQSPPSSRIDWVTYYFRDRELAQALMRASDRGVKVRLVLEPHPRRAGANDSVIAMLKDHGLGGGFHLRSSIAPSGKRGHLHAKIYAFSKPPIAWIGSFNPSGNEPENADVIAEIGDQDRGHNLLLGIERPKLIKALLRFIDRLIDPPRIPLKWRPSAYLPLIAGDSRLYFYPRCTTLAVEPCIARLGKGCSVRAAISHLKKGPLTKALIKAAGQGADIRLLVHDTLRRVSPKAFDQLESVGINIDRVVDENDLPMHAKFILLTDHGRTTAWLGSYNFNDKSRLLNAELLLATTDQSVIESLSSRFEQIEKMVRD